MKNNYTLTAFPKAGHKTGSGSNARPFDRATSPSKAEADADTIVFSTPGVENIEFTKNGERVWIRPASSFPSFRRH